MPITQKLAFGLYGLSFPFNFKLLLMAANSRRFTSVLLYIVLAAIAVCFFLLAFWTPLMQDDLVFMAQSADLSRLDEGVPASFSWGAWLDHCRLMYLENNGRLSNLLAPLGTWLLPQWGRALLIGLCSSWILFMVGRMAFGRSDNWKGLLLIWAVSLVAWPWRDRLMFWDYALNYLAASALLLPFLYLFCKNSKSNYAVILGSLCGFFGAWMHDGSALCMLAAVGSLALLRRFRLSRGQWFMVAALVAGTIAVLASPGEWQRASGEVGSNSLARNLFISLQIEPLAWVLGLLLVAMAVSRRNLFNGFLADDVMLSCSLMAFFSFVMSVLLDPSGRYGWQAGVFAAVALFGLAKECGVKLPRRLADTVVALAAVFVVVVMTSAIRFQHRLWDENAEIFTEAEASETGTVFRDLLTKVDEPFIALRIPTTGIWESSFQMACANAARSPEGKMIAVVPECFRNFAVDSIRPLGGDAGVGIYKDYLVSTDTVAPFDAPGFLCGAQRTAVNDLLLVDADGTATTRTFWLYKFRTPGADGRAVVFWGKVSGEVSSASMPR